MLAVDAAAGVIGTEATLLFVVSCSVLSVCGTLGVVFDSVVSVSASVTQKKTSPFRAELWLFVPLRFAEKKSILASKTCVQTAFPSLQSHACNSRGLTVLSQRFSRFFNEIEPF